MTRHAPTLVDFARRSVTPETTASHPPTVPAVSATTQHGSVPKLLATTAFGMGTRAARTVAGLAPAGTRTRRRFLARGCSPCLSAFLKPESVTCLRARTAGVRLPARAQAAWTARWAPASPASALSQPAAATACSTWGRPLPTAEAPQGAHLVLTPTHAW